MRPVLNGSTSIWEALPSEGKQAPRYPELHGQERTEVAIIGGGITGLVTGLLLARSGKAVVLLEAKAIPSGETRLSTAHVTEVLDEKFTKLIDRFGLEAILRYTEAHRMAIHRLGSLIEELDGPGACGWTRLPGYLYCENDFQMETLKKELNLLERLHIPSSFIKEVPLPFSVVQAIQVDHQVQLNPVALQQLLLRAFLAEGGKLYEHTPTVEISPVRKGVRVTTKEGHLSCDHCVLATHSPILATSIAHLEVVPRQTYVIAAKLKHSPLMNGLFWDMESPYHYLRMANGNLLVGGEDHRTGAPRDHSKDSLSRLDDYLRSRFIVDSVTGYWSGQVLESADGLPLVGPSLRSPRIFYATGYGGNGISQGALAGMLLSELVLGRKEDLSVLLNPHRTNRRTGLRKLIVNSLVYPKNLLNSRVIQPLAEKLRSEKEVNPEKMAPGEARVA